MRLLDLSDDFISAAVLWPFPIATRGFEPISYRGALLSTFLRATVYALYNLLNLPNQTVSKMGLQRYTALGSTQPLRDVSARIRFGVKGGRLTTS
jgi:hypothetical protein